MVLQKKTVIFKTIATSNIVFQSFITTPKTYFEKTWKNRLNLEKLCY